MNVTVIVTKFLFKSTFPIPGQKGGRRFALKEDLESGLCQYLSLKVKDHGKSMDVCHSVCCEWYKNGAGRPHRAGDDCMKGPGSMTLSPLRRCPKLNMQRRLVQNVSVCLVGKMPSDLGRYLILDCVTSPFSRSREPEYDTSTSFGFWVLDMRKK